MNRAGRTKGEKVISSCYFVLAKGGIQNSEMYTGLCKQGIGEYGQIISRPESSSVGKWVKEHEPRRRTEGKLENHSTTKQWIRQSTDKHIDKSKTDKIHAKALAASDTVPQRQPRLWPHSHCGCSLWFTWDGKTGTLWTLLDENNSLVQDKQNSVFKYLKATSSIQGRKATEKR